MAPLAIAIGVLGVVFGFVARSVGLSATGAVVMSAVGSFLASAPPGERTAPPHRARPATADVHVTIG